jgi:hypothetical protein
MSVRLLLAGSIQLRYRRETDFGRLAAELALAKGGHYGVPRALSIDRSEPRTLRIPIVLEGAATAGKTASKEIAEQLEAIETALGAPSTLQLYDSEPDGVNVTLRTLPSSGAAVERPAMVAGGLCLATLEVVCEPYAYSATQTLLSAAAALPGTIDLSAMQGSYETPLEVSFALANMTQVVLGLLEEPYADWSGWLGDANDLSWDSGVAAADGNAAGGQARKTAAGERMGAAIPVTSFPRGEYALWVRARMTSGSALLWSSSIGSDKALTVVNTAYRWHYLGRLICPTRHTYGAGTATTSLFIDPEGTADAWIDRYAFVRAAAGYRAYDGPACDGFADDGQHAYVDGRTDYQHVRGSSLYARRGKLCGLVETNGASGPSLSPTVVVKATPRTNLWR